eukprot:359025-Chlamydomonas_euryale.AAC.2
MILFLCTRQRLRPGDGLCVGCVLAAGGARGVQACERPGSDPYAVWPCRTHAQVVREASKRVLGLRPFDTQLIGGMILHEGQIAEMRTGA